MAYEAKTFVTDESPQAVVDNIAHARRRADAQVLLALCEEATGERAVVWSNNIIGFGAYDYVYPTGCKGRWMKSGFAARKSNMVVYVMTGFKKYDALLKKLGKHKTSVSCLYINKLADIDIKVLRQIITTDYQRMTEKYG